MFSKSKLVGFFIVSLCLLFSFTFSQTRETGALAGKVTTPDGEPLPGVEVTIFSPSLMGGTRSTITNQDGRYRFPALPHGTYSIETKLQGFVPQKIENIRLSVGETLTIDLVLRVGSLEESVEVVAVAPTIDVKDSQTSTVEMPREYLQQIPSGRNYRSQLKFAPGVSNESTFGSSESLANNFMIDGVKINSPEAGEAEVNFDYESIEEIKVMGLGAPAEYGGFSGAIVHVLSKSGGNQFSGQFTGFFQMPEWHSRNSDDPELIFKRFSEEYDLRFNLGGPIVKDKLWFFSTANYAYWQDHIEDYEDETEYGKEYRAMGKLTWQPAPADRFTLLVGWVKDPVFNVEAGPFTAPEAVPTDRRWQIVYNAALLHTFSGTTFLEAKFGGYYQKGRLELQSDNPPHFDLETEMLSGNFWEFWEFPRERYQLNASLSHYAENFIKGSHDFKFGVEFERSPLKNHRGYPGGALYYDLGGEPYLMITYDGYNADPTSQRISAFIQDSWSISDRITINPGLRINHWRGYLPDMGAVFKPKLGLAPRLGITIDLFGDNSTALKAHYGKYYHGLIGMFYLHLQPQGTYREYMWGPFFEEMEELDPGTIGDQWVLLYEDPWENEYTVDPDLKMTYMRQYVIGLERELFTDTSLGINFIYRTNHDFIDRVNLTGMWQPIQWTDPYFGQTYTVYEHLNPGDNQYLITNPKKGEDYGAAFPNIVGLDPTRKYRGLEFVFNKRYSHGWQLQLSYVYSKAWGSNDNSWGEFGEGRTSSLGSSTLFSNPNWQINAEGRLTNDPTHMFKASGSFIIPYADVSVGFFFSYITGNTYNKNIMLPDEIDPDPCAAFGGNMYILAEPLGSYRYPARTNLDLRLEKFFRFGQLRVSALVDIFNALNSSTVTDVETSVDPWSEYPFGYVWGIRHPRTFRAGFRIEF